MSITFQIAGATYTEGTEPCICEPGEYPDGNFTVCPYCQGKGVCPTSVSNLPELNMSNLNALDLLALINVGPVQSCGEWSAGALNQVHKNLMALMNTPKGERFEVEPIQEGNFFMGGRSKQYVDHRFNALLNIVVVAKQRGSEVFWA